MEKLPHPIPYQGSKRALAPSIFQFVPAGIETWYEPFCGSAAMTLYAASRRAAKHYVIGDSLTPIVDLIENIVDEPNYVSSRYEEVWNGQTDDNPTYFNQVRDRYNAERNSIDLLYLICRCVKNAVRFGVNGRFTQSHDKRRLGMSPSRMAAAVSGMSFLLKGKVEFCRGDWLETVSTATSKDFIYLDPPYFGTSLGRDKRYFAQLSPTELCAGLEDLNRREINFVLSYDGMTGEKEYAPPLPKHLKMTRKLLHAGRSTQSTLNGRAEDTVESLYLSQAISDKGEQLVDALGRLAQSTLMLGK